MKRKILIVEDTPSNVKILQIILGKENQLEVATSGEEALEKAAGFQPNIVLLDIMMPGIDGFETCRRLRAIPQLRDTKIIMISARHIDGEDRESREAGADDFLPQPFSDEELMEKIG